MSNYKKAIIALILSSIIWGAGPPIFKWALQDISPLMLAFYRFFLPTLILLLFFKRIQRIHITDTLLIALLAVFNCTLNIGLYFLGLLYAPSINAPVIASSGPIFLLIASSIFLRERASKKILFGNLVGLTGVLWIVLEPFLQFHQTYSIFGNFLFILSTISAVIGTIVTKKLSKRYNSLTLTFWTFLLASISLLPIPIDELTRHTLFGHFNLHALVGILFGALASSLLAYLLFYWGIHFVKASETAIFTYIDPVITIIIAIPLLHEFPTPMFILGALLVFLGIYIAEGRIHWHPLHKLLK